MPLKPLLLPLDYTPYHFALLGQFLAMSGYAFAVMFAFQQFFAAPAFRRIAWLALGAGLLALLRQSWARLEFTLATGIYDLTAAVYEILAVGFLLLAVVRFATDDAPAPPRNPPP